MWLGLFAANVGSDGGRHQAVVKRPQRAITAPVRLGRDAAAVRVPHQLSRRRDGDARGHGCGDAGPLRREVHCHLAE